MTVGSLFSGVGGIDLGLERAGHRTLWFCEADPFCRRVLRKHWPHVPIYDDIRTLRGADVVRPDLLAGGFPCQDVSDAGKRAGIDGERSGLWTEFHRLVREIRPRFVLVENVPGLLARGMGRVLGDLAAIGYDAEWFCLSAADVGAPHLRRRVFLLAYPNGERKSQPEGPIGQERRRFGNGGPQGRAALLADAHREGWQRAGRAAQTGRRVLTGSLPPRDGFWEVEPSICRVVDGFPGRVDRLRALGNAVCPPVAEWIGRQLARWTP